MSNQHPVPSKELGNCECGAALLDAGPLGVNCSDINCPAERTIVQQVAKAFQDRREQAPSKERMLLPLVCNQHSHVGYGASEDVPCPWCEIERLQREIASLECQRDDWRASARALDQRLGEHIKARSAPEPRETLDEWVKRAGADQTRGLATTINSHAHEIARISAMIAGQPAEPQPADAFVLGKTRCGCGMPLEARCPTCVPAQLNAGAAQPQRADLPKPINHDLWRHLHDEHGLTLMQSELDAILQLAQPPPSALAALEHVLKVFTSMADRGHYPIELLPYVEDKPNPHYLGKQGWAFLTDAIRAYSTATKEVGHAG